VRLNIRLAILLIMSLALFARAEVFTVASLEDVQDAPLLEEEFANWNFGGSPLLEAGFMGGIYTEHHAVSVIRFDLRNTACGQVKSAKLRLYKPKDFIQTQPVDVSVYEVSATATPWIEGAGICTTDGVKAADKVRHEAIALATARAPDDRGLWMEFALPTELVQRWLSDPSKNAGLYLATVGNEKEWGQHVYVYSSEHFLGNGPQLVIEGSRGEARQRADRNPKKVPLYALPPESSLDKWLKANDRLAKFAKDCRMTRPQSRVFQMFDTSVRENLIVGQYQRPLEQIIEGMPALIAKGDEAAVRKQLDELYHLLLKWEFIRETSWYTSGPEADFLSPWQLGELFSVCIFGQMESSVLARGAHIWVPLPPDKLDEHCKKVMDELTSRLKLTPQQVTKLTPEISRYEGLENDYLGRFAKSYERCKAMVKANNNTPEMFRVVRGMHLNHERFLYFQSIYNTPRWRLLTENTPTLPFAHWVTEARRGHYERAVSGSDKRKENHERDEENQ
jgi:hypothetical protein